MCGAVERERTLERGLDAQQVLSNQASGCPSWATAEVLEMKRGRRGEAKQMGRVMLANETRRAELRCCCERGEVGGSFGGTRLS